MILPHIRLYCTNYLCGIALKSHSIPSKTYTYKGEGGVDISSYKLCYLIARMQNWATERSYRIPRTVYEDKRIAIFDLRRAEIIER